MRTQLELWQVVKDNFGYFSTGLCFLIRTLKLYSIISLEETKSLTDDLKKYGNDSDFFLGVGGNPMPRLEFIEKMIKKHSKKRLNELPRKNN